VRDSAATRPPLWPLRRAIGITLVAGVIGWLQHAIASGAGWHFPSGGALAGEVAWNLFTIAIAAWALWDYDGVRLTLRTAGFRGSDSPKATPFPWTAAIAVAAVSVTLWLLVGNSATSGSSYGRTHTVGLWLLLAEVLVRYPLTVLAEEALFRGVLQPRLGRYGPVLSALCWGCYHLQQASTIPQLVAFGIGLGYMRWRFGNVRLTGIVHYLGDAAFFVITYG
jgi:membrane protease YdiL (CAAX protease family)